MPGNDDDLSNEYTEGEITDVSTKNDVRVSQTGTDFVIHQFKDYANLASQISVEWEGQSNVAPSLSPVLLQIYNVNTSSWDTVDTDNSSLNDVDFVLSGSIATADYKNISNVISCRVYQELL